MIAAYTVEQIRAAETVALQGDRDDAVMRRAAYEVAATILDRLPTIVGRPVVLLVGPGNNGGDALFAGATLRRRGMAVTAVLLVPGQAHPAGLRALIRAGGRTITAAEAGVDQVIGTAEVIIDGLLGLAARPPLRPPFAALVEKANAANALKVAVDLPTGVDPDSGGFAGAVFQADVTVTLGGMKAGLLISDSSVGQIVSADLGFEPVGAQVFSLTDLDARAMLPDPGQGDDKFSGGVPGIVAGSPRYPGAAILCVGGAVNLRPGMVRYAGPQSAAVVARWPEVIAGPDPESVGTVQSWVAGPGMGTDDTAGAALAAVLQAQVPVLVDADGLTILAGRMSMLEARRGRITLLTPHDREFARLFPDLDPADRLASVRAAAARSGATILLKGHRTLIADPAGRVAVNTTGSSWLATAGSGDVLSGMIGSLLAAGRSAWEAAAAGAHLHGRAGERAASDRAPGGGGVVAPDQGAGLLMHIRAEAVIDLDAVQHNTGVLLAVARKSNPAAELMAVVKADGYGHGAAPVALAARRAGATALGLATPGEAADLVAAGLESSADRPVVAWLWVPDQDIRPAIGSGVQLVVSSKEQLSAVLAVADVAPGGRPSIHLKIDTGLGRSGALPGDFAALAATAAAAGKDGRISVVGLMSHLACADVPGDESVPEQIRVFEAGCAAAGTAGVTVRWRHLANTPGTLAWPDATFDMVRCGIGLYGIDPLPGGSPGADGLQPAMTLRARVALTKRVPAGQGVSYGLTYRTTSASTLALVPIGYADGVPRTASGRAQVLLGGRRRRIAGRVAMDQFVVDCGDDDVGTGDEVVLFGPGADGEPTASDWAEACDTISYEIVSRIGPRVPRRYVGST